MCVTRTILGKLGVIRGGDFLLIELIACSLASASFVFMWKPYELRASYNEIWFVFWLGHVKQKNVTGVYRDLAAVKKKTRKYHSWELYHRST